jgi:hypothetical protein
MRRGLVPVLAVLLAGCTTAPSEPTGAPRAAATPGVAVTKVLTIVEENHGAESARDGMPFLASLARTYGTATDYRSLSDPSLPNYLLMAGGSDFGVDDNDPPAEHPLTGPSVFDTALAQGRTARTYADGMPTACALEPFGRYAVKHNPWAYFADDASRRGCQEHDVPAGTPDAGALHDDVVAGRLPQVGLLVPDLCHDAHDCSLGTADAWLRDWVRAVQDGPDWRAGRLALVVTFDEAGDGSPTLLTVVVAPELRERVVDQRLDHLSWSRWMTDLVDAPPLREAAGAPSLGAAFGL